MHGLIFAGLKNWIDTVRGAAAWPRLLAAIGRPERRYDHREVYPDAEALALFAAVAEDLSRPAPAVLETFGAFIAPKLLGLYRPLLDPSWTALELLTHVERAIHDVVRRRKPGAAPPRIRCRRLDESSALISYDSPRRLCALLRGIVRGVGATYGEDLVLDEEACMLRGDAACRLKVRRLRPAEETRSAAVPPTRRYTEPVDSGGAIGRYEITGVIGRGGMGAVYEARDPVLERAVAVKLFRGAPESELELRARFLREARAAARMSHPHIISVFDIGEDRGRLFYVMERIRGRDLREWRALHPEPREILDLARALARALDYAHNVGVIHRDLKPQNILVRDDGRPVIMDFGVAWDAADEVRLTRLGELLGTPSYMAPEQFEGHPELIGPHTDVYGLGACLYELLSGAPPFAGSSLAATVRKILMEEPPPLPEATGLPPELDAILRRCLAKAIDQRYPDTAALARDLQGLA